ncbi:MAG TPA: biotin/lipoyl-containing protein [Streptosporangiaceae bacterium]|nr:biotin/lipoyl-containing protein [Streptosporangiaceae bacterium]
MNSQLTDTSADDSGNLADLLTEVRSTALELVRSAPVTPTTLRVRAGGVAVEMEWAPAHAIGPAVTMPTPDATAGGVLVQVPEVPASGHALCAPAVGVFYRSPAPGAEPFVGVGDTVQPGQQVGIVEAMKLMIPVEADRAGRVTDILVADGKPVEYAEPLLTLDPLGGAA